MITALKILNDIQSLFFPEICFGCSNILNTNEQVICTLCRHKLPVSDSIQNTPNEVLKIFYGRVKLQHGCSLLQFHKKGIVQELMHNLKYRGQEQIGELLGAWMGNELKSSKNYQSIDYVIPIPLHPKKLKKRGYNQVSKFAQTISGIINAEYRSDILLKTNISTTQTTKNRFNRWQDLETTFKVSNPEILNKKHILIVDDIITTGATIEAGVKEIQNHAACHISVASMAITI